MIRVYPNEDIAKSRGVAVLYCDPRDFIPEQRATFDREFPEARMERAALFKNPAWTPGRITVAAPRGAGKAVIHGCITATEDGKATYANVREVIEKIRSVYIDKDLLHIASPLIGVGSGLLPDVIETCFRLYFDVEHQDPATNLRFDLYV